MIVQSRYRAPWIGEVFYIANNQGQWVEYDSSTNQVFERQPTDCKYDPFLGRLPTKAHLKMVYISPHCYLVRIIKCANGSLPNRPIWHVLHKYWLEEI